MEENKKISTIIDFLKFAYRELGVKSTPKIKMTSDPTFVQNNRSYGGYLPTQKQIIVYIKDRAVADILRTFAHEIVHHKQHEISEVDNQDGQTGSKIENEANAMAGVLMRKYGKINPLIFENRKLQVILENVEKYQIYCDMDGVICDFPAQFEHYTGMNPDIYYKEKGKIAFDNVVNEGGKEFWSKMPWTPTGKALWSKISKYGVIILSAPGSYDGAIEGKKEWIQNNLFPPPKQQIFAYKTKHKHEILSTMSEEERKKAVLIDDYRGNRDPWREAGGIAIKYTGSENADHTLDQIKSIEN